MTPFDVVLVPFPFADLSSSKRRPCLVLATFRPKSLGEHVIVAMMTSQVSPPLFPHDVRLRDFAQAKLPKPTLVRLSKVVTLDASLIVKRLGRLAEYDSKVVRKEFTAMFERLVA